MGRALATGKVMPCFLIFIFLVKFEMACFHEFSVSLLKFMCLTLYERAMLVATLCPLIMELAVTQG